MIASEQYEALELCPAATEQPNKLLRVSTRLRELRLFINSDDLGVALASQFVRNTTLTLLKVVSVQ